MDSTNKGKTLKTILIIFSIVVVLAIISFVVWKYALPQQGIFTSRPKTMAINAVIESHGISKFITKDGGQIELDSDTIKASLKLDKNSLLSDEVITLKEIKSLNTKIDEWKFIKGVEINPDGVDLLKFGQLELDIPSGTDLNNLSGFSFSGNGKDFYLYPIEIKDNKAIFQLNGFSGYGLINLGGYMPNTQPTEKSKQALQLINDILMEARVTMLEEKISVKELGEVYLDRIADILRVWYATEIEVTLSKAQTDDELFVQAGSEFFKWLGQIQLFGIEDKFSKQINNANKMLVKALENAVDKSSKKCVDEKDPLQASKLIYLLGYAQMIGYDSTDEIEEKAKKCAQFELRITSTIENTGETFPNNPDIGQYSGTVALSTDDALSLSGKGEVKVDSFKYIVGSEMEHGCTYSKELIYPIEVPSTQIKTTGNKPEVSLTISIKDPGEYEADCSFYIRGETYMVNEGNAFGANFDIDFWELHEDEILTHTEFFDEIYYLLPNWEIIGKGGVFARKVYNRTKNFTTAFNTQYKVKENTIFELIHKPTK